MSKIREEMMREATYNKAIEMAIRLIMRDKYTLEEVAEYTGLSLDKVQELTDSK